MKISKAPTGIILIYVISIFTSLIGLFIGSDALVFLSIIMLVILYFASCIIDGMEQGLEVLNEAYMRNLERINSIIKDKDSE